MLFFGIFYSNLKKNISFHKKIKQQKQGAVS